MAQKNDFSRNVTKKILTAEFAVDRTRARLNDPLLYVTKKIRFTYPTKKNKKWIWEGRLKNLIEGVFGSWGI